MIYAVRDPYEPCYTEVAKLPAFIVSVFDFIQKRCWVM